MRSSPQHSRPHPGTEGFVPGIVSARDQGQLTAVGWGILCGAALLVFGWNTATLVLPTAEAARLLAGIATGFAVPALAIIGFLSAALIALRIQNRLDPSIARTAEISHWRDTHRVADYLAGIAVAVAVLTLPALGNGPESAGVGLGVALAGAISAWLAVARRFLPVPDARTQLVALRVDLERLEADVALMRSWSPPSLPSAFIGLLVRGFALLVGLPLSAALLASTIGADARLHATMVAMVAVASGLNVVGVLMSLLNSTGSRRARSAMTAGSVVALSGWVFVAAPLVYTLAMAPDIRGVPFAVAPVLLAVLAGAVAAPGNRMPRRWSTRAAITRIQLDRDERSAVRRREQIATLDALLDQPSSKDRGFRAFVSRLVAR